MQFHVCCRSSSIFFRTQQRAPPIWSVRVGAKGLSAACTGTVGTWNSAAISARRGCFIAALVAATQAAPPAPLWDAPTCPLGLVLNYLSGHPTGPRCIGRSVPAATWATALRGPPFRGFISSARLVRQDHDRLRWQARGICRSRRNRFHKTVTFEWYYAFG